jgi:hypothetical protein
MTMHEHTDNVSIPRPPDMVTILWERNPLDRQAPRNIVEATVIGSANPCERLSAQGQRYRTAAHCLLDNGFEQITAERLEVFGVAVFVREY